MPTYDYTCEGCGHQLEVFQSIKADPIKKCPHCKKSKLKRLIGMGAGIIFRGSGFYETDYRSDGYKKSAESDKPAASTPAKSESSSSSTAPAAAAPGSKKKLSGES